MPSFADNIFIFILALLLLGPKKLPKLARELGKWVGEFRRASADFRMQMDDELRASEQAEKQQKADAMLAAHPAANPNALPEPEHPHTPVTVTEAEPPQAIATSGEVSILPPSTGLPTPQARTARDAESADVGSLLDSIPAAAPAQEGTHA